MWNDFWAHINAEINKFEGNKIWWLHAGSDAWDTTSKV
jgi:hypothetical protein